MKITVPALRTDVVGFRYDQPARFYYNDPNRPNVVPHASYKLLTETKLTTRVAFDRDLRIADRFVAVGQIGALSAFMVVAVPLALTHCAGEQIGKGLRKLVGLGEDALDAIGVHPAQGIRREFARLGREVVR